MQETTKQELREVKALVRKVLTEHPETRGHDDTLYYKVCKEYAHQVGVDINTLHFSAVFLGNPLGFPRYESVVRLRRLVQRQEPELQAKDQVRGNRKKKQADYIEMAQSGGMAL